MSESLIIQLPGDTDPMERHDRYGKPLDKALREAGRLGKSVGGGTGMTLDLRGATVECCHIDVEVTDLRKAVPVIRAALVKAKAPVGTLVAHFQSDSVLLHFTARGPEVVTPVDGPLAAPAPRVPWAAGEVIGYRLTPDRWVLLHVVAIDTGAVVVRVPEWCGAELPPAKRIADLLRRPPTKYRLQGAFRFPTARVGPFSVRLTRPRVINVRRGVRTGVTEEPTPRERERYHTTDPAYFDRTLSELFGLVPVSGAARLYNDLGIGPMHHHLAAWDAGRAPVTAARARRLFYAHVDSNPVTNQPLRGTAPATEKTRRFVAELKARFKGTGVWGWGSFRAGEGFVIIPVDAESLTEVWTVAVRLGAAHGITVYDPQANRVARPRQPAAAR